MGNRAWKYWVIASILAAALWAAGAPKAEPRESAGATPSHLVPFEDENGKFGFKDETGRIVIEPTYDEARDFGFGLAPVNRGAKWEFPGLKSGGKWGYINQQGKVVVPFTLDYAHEFSVSDGLAKVVDEQGVRFIDPDGKTVITLGNETSAGDFREGVAPVWLYRSLEGKGWQTRFINKKGETVFTIDGYAEEFYDGLAVLKVQDKAAETGSKCGFIDHTGKVVIASQFFEADHFAEGLAPVRTEERTWDANRSRLRQESWGYVDRTGKYVIAPHFNEAHPFVSGVALVHLGGELQAVMDAPFYFVGGEWLVIDKTGKVLKRSAEWIDIRSFVREDQTTKDEIKELPNQGMQYIPQARPEHTGARGIRAVAPAVPYAPATANGSPGIVTVNVPQRVQLYREGGSR